MRNANENGIGNGHELKRTEYNRNRMKKGQKKRTENYKNIVNNPERVEQNRIKASSDVGVRRMAENNVRAARKKKLRPL